MRQGLIRIVHLVEEGNQLLLHRGRRVVCVVASSKSKVLVSADTTQSTNLQ